ncbi:hypothetical protein [Rhizobium sp. PL01]|uniref:hypothetical protein n=1 Tax=Rhizobium sp. PL01 TaxID=3085631 RepID=UPI00298199F5|nr:hypothetical protein [Rhizobium sp. PL01]MDW5317985.1 hypothetical protein [Rhizobium sp. PL01]
MRKTIIPEGIATIRNASPEGSTSVPKAARRLSGLCLASSGSIIYKKNTSIRNRNIGENLTNALADLLKKMQHARYSMEFKGYGDGSRGEKGKSSPC